MTEARKSKRSRRVALTTLTAVGTAATLSGCGEGNAWGDGPTGEGQVFASVAECAASGAFSQQECQDAYSQAQADDANAAPRFQDQPTCEQEFGSGACQPRVDSTGSFWVPALAGFVIGGIAGEVIDEIGDARRRRYRYAGLYRNRERDTWYTGGGAYAPLARGSGGRYNFSGAALNRPVSPPRTFSSSDVASRGGFGSRAGRSSSGGSWGG